MLNLYYSQLFTLLLFLNGHFNIVNCLSLLHWETNSHTLPLETNYATSCDDNNFIFDRRILILRRVFCF